MAPKRYAAFGTALIALTIGAAPILTSAADHLDAPALGGTVVDGAFAPHSEHGDRDINDLYVFPAPDASNRTVLVMTTNPAINLFGGNFGKDVRYTFNIDKNGDNKADLAYVVRFKAPDDRDDKFTDQDYTIRRYTGKRAQTLTGGKTVARGESNEGNAKTRDGLRAYAGTRSDPFFFDLLGFLGTTQGVGSENLTDGQSSDFFAELNTNAIVLSIPNAQLPDSIGVWATTTYKANGKWRTADQMGRPAINTVFNPTADKNDFNRTPPHRQATAFGGKFVTNVVNTLLAFSAFDAEGPYAQGEAEALAGVLIPDVLTYSRSSSLPAPLNGRGLADDVIDTELNIVTGGDPLGLFAGRDATGGITGDGVGPHTDYLPDFPYLGLPH